MQHVLVTGGAGFIGSQLVDALVAAGRQVTVLDNLDPSAHAGEPTYLNPATRYVWGDVRDRAAWDSVLDGVDAISHQAGKVGLGVDFGDADAYVDHNVVGWVTGLRALHDRRFDGRVVLGSSMVVYGEGRYVCGEHGIVRPGPRAAVDLEAGLFEATCPTCDAELQPTAVPENAPLDPRNVYAATKLHQEHLLEVFARDHSIDASMLRYHNVYGPRMPRDTPYAGVAAIFRSALERGEAPLVTEDGAQMRNFVHVRDVVAANLAALDRSGPVRAFNVASSQPRSVGEMANALATAFGATQRSSSWPQVTGRFRLGDVRHVFASTERASKELGYTSAIAFDYGVAEFAQAELRSPVDRAS